MKNKKTTVEDKRAISFYLTKEIAKEIADSKKNNGYIFALKEGNNYYPLITAEWDIGNGMFVHYMGSTIDRMKYENWEVIPYNKSKINDHEENRLARIYNSLLMNRSPPWKKIDKMLTLIPEGIHLYTEAQLPGCNSSFLLDITKTIVYGSHNDLPEEAIQKIEKEKKDLEKLLDEQRTMEFKRFNDRVLAYGRKNNLMVDDSDFFCVLDTD